MKKVKAILRSLESYKDKIIKFFIICATIQFYSSTLYRIYDVKDSRTQIETTINLYSLIFVGLVFINEFFACILCNFITDNLKVITHHTGKGLVYIIISFIYMSPNLGSPQNYSAYLMFSFGLLLVFSQCLHENDHKSPFELALERSKQKNFNNEETKNNAEVKIDFIDRDDIKKEEESNNYNYNEMNTSKGITQQDSEKKFNPYDYPDDF